MNPAFVKQKIIRLGLLVSVICSASALVADSITTIVHNETTGKPSAGDQVILLLQAHGMQEEWKTRTDDEGSFTLPIRLPGGQYVIRVVHDDVNYELPWTAGKVPDIRVFDAVSAVPVLKGYATIMKVESDGTGYLVTEMHAIVNKSSPPRTQNNPLSMEVYLPAKAQFVSAIAVDPGGEAVNVTPIPVGKKAGHYAIGFPLRPGMTRYVIRYRVAVSERLVFHPWLNYPTKQVSVVIPKSMRFAALDKTGFHPIIDKDGVRVEVLNEARAGWLPAFALSGSGTLPQIRNAVAGTKELPLVGKNSHVSGHDVLTGNSLPVATGRIKMWLLSSIFVVIGVGVLLVIQRAKLKENFKV